VIVLWPLLRLLVILRLSEAILGIVLGLGFIEVLVHLLNLRRMIMRHLIYQ
jgi:hypothetical protein